MQKLVKYKVQITSHVKAALEIRPGQRPITTNLWPLTAHIYHVMIIVTDGFSKKSFLLLQYSNFILFLFSFYLFSFSFYFIIILILFYFLLFSNLLQVFTVCLFLWEKYFLKISVSQHNSRKVSSLYDCLKFFRLSKNFSFNNFFHFQGLLNSGLLTS